MSDASFLLFSLLIAESNGSKNNPNAFSSLFFVTFPSRKWLTISRMVLRACVFNLSKWCGRIWFHYYELLLKYGQIGIRNITFPVAMRSSAFDVFLSLPPFECLHATKKLRRGLRITRKNLIHYNNIRMYKFTNEIFKIRL